MNILAVDTSGKTASCAVLKDRKLVAEYILNDGKTHSEKLMFMIESICSNSNIKIKDIDLFAAANGPGSFTGLRIGVACVKGLAQVLNKPVTGVSALEGLAYGISGVECMIAPILDARRFQVYNALYKWTGGKLVEITAPRALDFRSLELELRGEKVIFTGDIDLIESLKPEYDKELETDNLRHFVPQILRAGNIASLALCKEHMEYSKLSVNYIRKSQAERTITAGVE